MTKDFDKFFSTLVDIFDGNDYLAFEFLAVPRHFLTDRCTVWKSYADRLFDRTMTVGDVLVAASKANSD